MPAIVWLLSPRRTEHKREGQPIRDKDILGGIFREGTTTRTYLELENDPRIWYGGTPLSLTPHGLEVGTLHAVAIARYTMLSVALINGCVTSEIASSTICYYSR